MLGDKSTARQWSVLVASRNSLRGFVMGTRLDIRTSTTEAFWLVYVTPPTLLGCESIPRNESWASSEA